METTQNSVVVPWTARTQTYRVDIIHNGAPGEFTKDMTKVAKSADFMAEHDMAALLGILDPLRDWLENHGALTPGSRVLVRVLPDDIAPEILAEVRTEERHSGGRVLDTRWVTAKVTPHQPTRARR